MLAVPGCTLSHRVPKPDAVVAALKITARVRLDAALAAPDADAVQVNLLEQVLDDNTARMDEGVLSVEVPAYGLVTVMVGSMRVPRTP